MFSRMSQPRSRKTCQLLQEATFYEVCGDLGEKAYQFVEQWKIPSAKSCLLLIGPQIGKVAASTNFSGVNRPIGPSDELELP